MHGLYMVFIIRRSIKLRDKLIREFIKGFKNGYKGSEQ